MNKRSPTINVMTNAAYKASRRMMRDLGEIEQLQVSNKGPADFVSTADLRTEAMLRAELTKARPEFGFLLEEKGAIAGKDDRHRWIVDPLDGTTNFLHGIPYFAISIALERDGQIVAGVVYEPVRDEMFWAEKGIGAYLNDRRIRVSARRKLDEAVIATGIPHIGRADPAAYLPGLEAIMRATAGVRRFGAASLDLAYVAAGRCDGFWEFGLAPWDMAAGLLLVREAGGYVSEVEGGEKMLKTGSILAANDQLHTGLGKLLRAAKAATPA